MTFFVAGEEFECEFCSLEFRTRIEWNNHIIQHFKQRNCSDCGNILIRVGDIWYGPHSGHTCDQSMTEVQYKPEVQEIILPDFIEVKDEEIYDVVDDDDDDSDDDNDIFDEALTYSDAHTSHEDTQPYSMKQLKKDVKLDKNIKKGTQLTSLTEDQLQSRVCPICQKMIVNKQNLICHINIHNGIKPFVCQVCSKSFAHIRNLVRHKEQQRHFDTEFKCKVKGCKKTFMTTNKLARHEKSAHSSCNETNSIDRPYACAHCDKAFFTPGFLKMHLRLCHSSCE